MSTDGIDRPSPLCPECRSPLCLSQPDVGRGDELLAACPGCRLRYRRLRWYLYDGVTLVPVPAPGTRACPPEARPG